MKTSTVTTIDVNFPLVCFAIQKNESGTINMEDANLTQVLSNTLHNIEDIIQENKDIQIKISEIENSLRI